jgi:peptide/nickel transport system ATP-binding protein
MLDVPLLEARHLSLEFTVHDRVGATRTIKVLDDICLSVQRGDIVGIIGESGSGKTSLARIFAMMYPPTSGMLLLEGEPAAFRNAAYLRRHRATVQLMFQDPFASLNPMHRLRYALGRALRLYGFKGGNAELETQILALLARVQLNPAASYIDKFPHQLSGGQRQRVVLARALAARPKVLLADEPISMLDVSIRAEILNLLGNLRAEEDLAVVYVTHDVASARYLCNHIAVIYAGQIVEYGDSEQVIQNPQHPYTRLLLDASPDPAAAMHLSRAERFHLAGSAEPPNLAALRGGCRFAARCPIVLDRCRQAVPQDVNIDSGHRVRCGNLQQAALVGMRTPSGQPVRGPTFAGAK